MSLLDAAYARLVDIIRFLREADEEFWRAKRSNPANPDLRHRWRSQPAVDAAPCSV